MDFDDARDSLRRDSPSNTTGSGLELSSQSSGVRASRRGFMVSRMRKIRPSSLNCSDDEDNVSKESNTSMVVRGAGTSSWAVQDAGTLQMLKDECSYLCSALLSARSPSQAIETALDLAELLSSKKSRNVLWQSCINSTTPIMVPSPPLPSKGFSVKDKATSPIKSVTKTILHSILDVVACMGNQSSTVESRKVAPNSTFSTSKSIPGSPSRGARTKSARRKLKQQQHFSSQESQGVGAYWLSGKDHKINYEMSQIIALIVYYISLDCTLSKEHSAAAMGVASKPGTARTVRQTLLQHEKALQGIAQLCLPSNGKCTKKGRCIPSYIDSCDLLTKQQFKSRKRRQGDVHVADHPSSPTEDSLSSLSFGDKTLAAAITPKSRGDPTKMGRLNRKRRRIHGPLCDNALPAVPEGDNLDDLDWPGQRVVPPPTKRATTLKKGTSMASKLSFTSAETKSSEDNNSFLFSEPPARKGASSRVPLSPEHHSADSSVVSVETTNSFITPRFAQKLSQLLSKVHLSSSPEDTVSLFHDCCGYGSPPANPWVSLVCLESLNRIISGKECDGPSCLTDEQNDFETAPDDDEESNPLLQTNRQIGKSGIIPMLAQSMSEELRWSFNETERSHDCQTCWKNWHERISVLASLIDGACLFNKANRQSFAEYYDPFSFEHDSFQNNTNQGLIFHILCFLHNGLPSRQCGCTRKDCDESKYSILCSSTRLIALRTLTSLTHNNELAAQHMIACYTFNDQETSIDLDEDHEKVKATLHNMRGIDVLAKLIFELESNSKNGQSEMASSFTGSNKREDDLHRYDSTIFSLNTLANIIEESDVRRLLAEITVPTVDGEMELWIQWLCKWLIQKTATFRDAILGIGKTVEGSQTSERALKKSDDDKLVAAGNCCVLLACLMIEPEEMPEDPESTKEIRELILEQLQQGEEGKSTGVTIIINTLKAFCNYYHFSLGELSLAIVGPVKKLIEGLEELRKQTDCRI